MLKGPKQNDAWEPVKSTCQFYKAALDALLSALTAVRRRRFL